MIRFISSSLKFQDLQRTRASNKSNLLLVADSTYYEGVGNKFQLALNERDLILDIMD